MKINITGRNVGITESMREYAEERAGKLERYFDRTHRIEVILNIEADRCVAEMIVSAGKGITLVGRDDQEDMYAAIDLVTDKMERQLKKYKEKLQCRRGFVGPGQVDAEEEEGGEESEAESAPEAEVEMDAGEDGESAARFVQNEGS